VGPIQSLLSARPEALVQSFESPTPWIGRHMVRMLADAMPRDGRDPFAVQDPRSAEGAMSTIDRRTFLSTSGAALAGVALGRVATRATATAGEAPSKPWRKAFMLGGVGEGPVLPRFELLKEAGFEGVELISPN